MNERTQYCRIKLIFAPAAFLCVANCDMSDSKLKQKCYGAVPLQDSNLAPRRWIQGLRRASINSIGDSALGAFRKKAKRAKVKGGIRGSKWQKTQPPTRKSVAYRKSEDFAWFPNIMTKVRIYMYANVDFPSK